MLLHPVTCIVYMLSHVTVHPCSAENSFRYATPRFVHTLLINTPSHVELSPDAWVTASLGLGARFGVFLVTYDVENSVIEHGTVR